MRRISPIAGAALFALLSTPWPAAALAQTYQSAAVCAVCHVEIHRTWQGSQHASAFTDPAFRLPYDRLLRENPRKTFSCEQCHNPMRFLLSPGDPRAAIFSREGVTCDFCHSVESVTPGGPFPRYKANPGAKFGPQGGTGKSPHGTKFSRLHITSEICAGCHEYRNEHGTPILTTASEWEDSFYRGTGVHCQFCHLPQLFDANIAGIAEAPLSEAYGILAKQDRRKRIEEIAEVQNHSGRDARTRGSASVRSISSSAR